MEIPFLLKILHIKANITEREREREKADGTHTCWGGEASVQWRHEHLNNSENIFVKNIGNNIMLRLINVICSCVRCVYVSYTDLYMIQKLNIDSHGLWTYLVPTIYAYIPLNLKGEGEWCRKTRVTWVGREEWNCGRVGVGEYCSLLPK